MRMTAVPRTFLRMTSMEIMGESNMSTLPKPCKRHGDMVVVIPCPDHEVDLVANRGFFIMDMTTIGKKTETELGDYIRNLSETTGCIGEEDCSASLEDAIEEAEKPVEFLCPEEEGPLHTTRSDRSCRSHPDTSCTGNIVRTLLMTHRALRKNTKRGTMCGACPPSS